MHGRRDYVCIGSSPCDEDCAQTSDSNYTEQALSECHAYIGQLRRQFGEEPASAELAVKRFPNDFGAYLTVICYFYPWDEDAREYAYKLEGEPPQEWDAGAREQLRLKEVH